ncbi:MAG TPA: hypothetical protein VGW78_05225 [Candidatus Babeliales bacterium]|jgi:TPR repeat protein|nr:hypothetical protein [Candidatus Babeliales bacterium]
MNKNLLGHIIVLSSLILGISTPNFCTDNNTDDAITLSFKPTSLLLGKPVEGIPQELIEKVHNAFKEKNLDLVIELLAPYASNNPEALTSIGLAKLYKGDVEGFSDLKKAANTYNHPCAYCNMGMLFYYTNAVGTPIYDEAITYLQKAAEYNVPEACTLLGIMSFQHNDIEHAKKYLQTAALQQHQPAMFHLAHVYINGQEFDSAKKLLYDMIETPESERDYILYPEALNTLGWIYAFVEHNTQQGLPYLHKAADAFQHPGAHYNLGSIYYQEETHDTEKAIFYLEKFLENPEGHFKCTSTTNFCIYAHQALANIYNQTHNKQKCFEHLHIVAERYHNFTAMHNIWWDYILQNKMAEGITWLRTIADNNPLSPANALTGIMLCELSPDEANTYINKNPDSDLNTYFKALLLCTQDNTHQAIPLFESLVKQHEAPIAGAVFALWQIYAIANDTQKAEEYKKRFDAIMHIDFYSLFHILATVPGEVVPSLYYLARMPLLAFRQQQRISETSGKHLFEGINFDEIYTIKVPEKFFIIEIPDPHQKKVRCLLIEDTKHTHHLIGLASMISNGLDAYFDITLKKNNPLINTSDASE